MEYKQLTSDKGLELYRSREIAQFSCNGTCFSGIVRAIGGGFVAIDSACSNRLYDGVHTYYISEIRILA